MTLGQTVATFGGIFLLAAVVEALTEYLVRPIVKLIYVSLSPSRQAPETMDALRYVSAVVGVVLCWAYNMDLLAMAGLTAQVPFVGVVVTGLLIGRGSNFVNDFVAKYLVREK
jgi:hypothetical protein